MATRPRFQRFRQRTRQFRNYVQRRRTRRYSRPKKSNMKKYLMYAGIAILLVLFYKNKQKVMDMIHKIFNKE